LERDSAVAAAAPKGEEPRDAAPAGHDAQSLAAGLAPLLVEQCEGRLSNITWFKADWQRGGAATATATYINDQDQAEPVVLKLPVVQRELLWTQRLQPPDGECDPPVVPRLFASGATIGGYDLAWIVIERFDHGPLGLKWADDHIPRIADAVARFYKAAGQFSRNGQARREHWPALIDQAIKSLGENAIDEKQRWKKALKQTKKQLDSIVEQWRARPITDWLHGDLHIANAMSRVGMNDGEVALIDLAEVRPGHWVEDAVYLERLLWARPERMNHYKPVKAIAQARKDHGLPVDEHYPRLAMIRRALLAATAPTYIKSEGNPAHLAACLNWLETALRELK